MQDYAIKSQSDTHKKTMSALITGPKTYINDCINITLNSMVIIQGCDCKVKVKDTFCPMGQVTVYLKKRNGARIYY